MKFRKKLGDYLKDRILVYEVRGLDLKVLSGLSNKRMEDVMKNRDKWIAVIFLLLIFTIPVITLIRVRQPGELSEEAIVVLTNNGTMQEQNEKQQVDSEEDSNSDVNDPALYAQSSDNQESETENSKGIAFDSFQNAFANLQIKLNSFTETLLIKSTS